MNNSMNINNTTKLNLTISGLRCIDLRSTIDIDLERYNGKFMISYLRSISIPSNVYSVHPILVNFTNALERT